MNKTKVVQKVILLQLRCQGSHVSQLHKRVLQKRLEFYASFSKSWRTALEKKKPAGE